MADAVRRLKANRPMEGKPCAACGRRIAFGDDAAVCLSCEALHDGACWDKRGGCATPGCDNAPLQRLASPTRIAAQAAAAAELPPGKIACPHCGRVMGARLPLCPKCKRAPTPDGVYRGPVTNAPGAVGSMVWGIVGLVFFGIILGFVVIGKSNQAKRLIASDPRYGGQGYATAGFVLGICDIVVFALNMIFLVGGSRR